MSYTPTTWNTGDTITASALNKMEQGIADGGGGALVTTFNSGTGKLDKTVQEIYDAMESGTPVFISFKYGSLPTDYVSRQYLAPIIEVYAYQYSDTIRIVATWTNASSVSSGSGNYLFAPCTAIFSASGLNEYPSYYRNIIVKSTSLDSTQGIY